MCRLFVLHPMGRSLKHFKMSIITVLKACSGHCFIRELVIFSQNEECGIFTREASGSNATFDGRDRAARYQLSIAVSAPWLSHDSLYCSRSGLEKTLGGECPAAPEPAAPSLAFAG
jgi:hypothetical protein